MSNLRMARAVLLILATLLAAGAASVLGPVASAQAASVRTWDRLAQCESGGNWRINTGNGYYGGLQFSGSTWRGFGGGMFAGFAHQATKSEQITVAERVLRHQGWGAWPACSSKLGLR
jgi:resuscitation-promoting factor RpfA